MGVGGHPGLTFKVKVTSNNVTSAAMSGDGISIGIGGDPETVEYFKMGAEFVVHFRTLGGPDTGGGAQEPPSREPG